MSLNLVETTEENTCKGLIFKSSVGYYISKTNSIESKTSLRLMKRLSCPGCEKCGWIMDYLNEDFSLKDMIKSPLGEIEDKKLYSISFNKFLTESGHYEIEDYEFVEYVEKQ